MNIIFIGPPGSGKGTQSKSLSAFLGTPHLSTGDMLRAAGAEGTELGKRAAPIMKAGSLVPDDLMVQIIDERIEAPDCANGFVLDGFPRTLAQAQALDALLRQKKRRVGLVVALHVDEVELIRRLLGRSKNTDNPRPDDNLATIQHRLDIYRAETLPALDYYGQQGVAQTIDGMKTADEVFSQIRAAVENASM